MGNFDRWKTPKQIKVERAGEPRKTGRGILKKGQRRKGKKARVDEILSAMNDCKRYAQWMIDDRKRRVEHPEWYRPIRGYYSYDPKYDEWFDRVKAKLDSLVTKAISDLQIAKEDATKYSVEKP